MTSDRDRHHRRTRRPARAESLRLKRTSRDSLEYPEAWIIGKHVLRDVLRGVVDLDRDYPTIKLAAEFFWDHGHLDAALMLVDGWALCVQHAKLHDRRSVSDEVVSMRDTLAARLRAALMHRSYDPIGAWTVVKAEHRRLKNQAGGAEKLSKLVSLSPFEGLGLQYTELLDTAVPAGRRVPESIRGPHHALFLNDAITIVDQILDGDVDAHGERFSLVDRTLFAILELADPEVHGEIVASYLELDERLRPRDQRGMATRHLMLMEIARYHGDRAASEHHACLAASDLRAAQLHRHLRELQSRYH